MIEFLEYIDTRLFLFFNGHHTPFMDSVMGAITNKYTWIPFYLILLFFVWKKAKSRMWLVVLSVAIMITVSDQVSVHLFKETFQRYRPSHNLLLQEQVQLIDGYRGGLYGFVSSHAANAFALTTFLIFFFRRRDFALFMYLWASVVCYSRVYAGVHYPFDILGGMLVGVFIGFIAYRFYFNFEKGYRE